MRTATASYKGHRRPVEIIDHCVWLYFRFPLSFVRSRSCCCRRSVGVEHPQDAHVTLGPVIFHGQELSIRTTKLSHVSIVV